MKSLLRILPHRRSVGAFVAAGIVVLTASIQARASIITWDAAQNIAGDSDVSNAGSLVGAFKLGAEGVGNATVNGVTFTGLAVSGTSTTSGNFNLSSAGNMNGANSFIFASGPFGLSSAYETLISSNASTFGYPFDLTMSGLISGATYQFEWWSSNNLGSPIQTYATAGNSVTLDSTTGPYGPNLWLPGQFATGTFVADGTAAQTITFSTAYFTQVNAFQLRQISTVPDAGSTLALLGFGLLGLAALRRRVR